MAADRIYLIGFMGAGKSTVGRELSHKLQWPFFDLDSEIQKAEGLPVRQIFERHGESRFRELEKEHLKTLAAAPKGVIALGGGAYLDPDNRALVEATGVSVWLDGSFAVIRKRIRPDGARPLWADPEKARQLYEQRRPTYELAQVHVLTDNRLPDAIAAEIIRKVVPT
jgi:shikimate kinase